MSVAAARSEPADNLVVRAMDALSAAEALLADATRRVRKRVSVEDNIVGRLFDSDLQIVAGGQGGFKPFWFHEQAGGAFTAGAGVGLPKDAHDED